MDTSNAIMVPIIVPAVYDLSHTLPLDNLDSIVYVFSAAIAPGLRDARQVRCPRIR